VALCETEAVEQAAQAVLTQYRQRGHNGKLLVPSAP
jgi:hypothetical protein